jgi:methylated-DNA-[protein]-cysteine S-methyltransferase
MTIEYAEIDSPLGELAIAANGSRVVALCFEGVWPKRRLALEARFAGAAFARTPDPAGALSRLREYLDGDLHALDDVEVEPAGTPFQRSVWSALRRIPVGRTCSYAALAADVGRPAAVRAVGAANGANPVAIIVPCHRVIGSDGSLTGFGGGLPNKRWLLAHERALPADLFGGADAPAAAAF